jgi:class 3 adenylate cyclase/tetratricopeptide (TPR) repeat protein
MRCAACGSDNPATNSYCECCGAALDSVCLQCGKKNLLTARYCGGCGATLGRADGERKHATVMFADIVGSTQLIAELDPEQALERLQPLLAKMCAAVKNFDGTVVRAMGDGIMALFGAPRAQEGHAHLACQAAIAIQAAIMGGDSNVKLRIGLHTGELVSSVLASDPTKEHGAHGFTVHVASRVQSWAEPGTICLTENCYRLVRAYCDVRPLGSQIFKGIPHAIGIYGLQGLKPAIASQQFRGTNLTSFLGRSRELSMMRRALRSTASGKTRVIGISGLPGSGKSRLCYEFAEWCRSKHIPVLEARAQLYGHATPLQLVLEFLRLLFRISPTDDAASARRRIAQRFSTLAPTFQPDLPLIYDILNIADDESSSPQIHPKTRYSRVLDIARHLIRHDGVATSLILIEDLHWLDEASDDFVTMLVDAVDGTRTLLVVNYRPSYLAQWMQSTYYQEVSLADLGASDMGALVSELISAQPALRDIRQLVVRRSGGNPFFAEELVRSLVEDGILFGKSGDYCIGTGASKPTLPPTVEAVIGARIDRLGEGEKAVVQVAAIIGQEFPLPVLKEVVGSLALDVEAILERLRDNELIQEHSLLDERQFAFRHPLIQEVAYGSQLRARRSDIHAAVARAMEGYHRNRLNEFAGLIAHHFDAAGLHRQAAHYEARAARWIGSTKPGQAIRHWEKVRSLLQDQPRSQESDSLRIMASGQIAWLGWREGLTADKAKPFISEAVGWARETDNTMIPLLLFVEARITAASGGSADIYVERVREALSLVGRNIAAGRAATLNCALSQAYGWAGLLNEALAANDAAMQGARDVDKFDNQFLGYDVEHWILSLRGRILLRLGRFAEAEQMLNMMLSQQHKLIDPTVQFIPHLGYVDLAWCRQDRRLAQEHAARIHELAEKHGTPYLRVFALTSSGIAKSLANEYSGAIRDFSRCLKLVRTVRAALEYEPETLASLADCHYEVGNFDRAIMFAKDTIRVAQQRSARLPECRASIACAAALIGKFGPSRLLKVEDLLTRAKTLISISGAKIYEPLLLRQRVRLSTLVA